MNYPGKFQKRLSHRNDDEKYTVVIGGSYDAENAGHKPNPFVCKRKTQNIKREIVKKLIKKSKSRYDIILFLWLCQFQNSVGIVEHVTLREVMEDIGKALKDHHQNFYQAIDRLEKNGFVRAIRDTAYGEWRFEIINNAFFRKSHSEEGFLDLSQKPFFCEAFYKLSLKAQKALIKICLNNQDNFRVSFDTLRSEYLGGATVKESNALIEELKTVIDVNLGFDKNYRFILRQEQTDKENENSASLKHQAPFKSYRRDIIYLCKKFKAQYEESSLLDMCRVFVTQPHAILILNSVLMDILRQKRSLEPALINSIVAERLREAS